MDTDDALPCEDTTPTEQGRLLCVKNMFSARIARVKIAWILHETIVMFGVIFGQNRARENCVDFAWKICGTPRAKQSTNRAAICPTNFSPKIHAKSTPKFTPCFFAQNSTRFQRSGEPHAEYMKTRRTRTSHAHTSMCNAFPHIRSTRLHG